LLGNDHQAIVIRGVGVRRTLSLKEKTFLVSLNQTRWEASITPTCRQIFPEKFSLELLAFKQEVAILTVTNWRVAKSALEN
jgi:hypothetical protein